MAKMNYGAWFYNQHRYRKNSRGTIESFNDTKWATINERISKLVKMDSSLLVDQPFMVNGNQMAFRKLIDLMGRSNYTFDDLDDALKETYRMSLQNTMSRNLVNTHAVMFHGSNVKDSNVAAESFTHYKIIEAPYDQLHFGARDEFIRQKLQEMHTTQNKYFVPISKFNSSEFVKILDFSIMCTVNGYFCNDCLIAMDDKGFKFKIGWPYTADVDFIVYKLDHAQVISTNVSSSYIEDKKIIPYSVLGVTRQYVGLKCIVNIFDKNFTKTSPSAPNFGIFTKEGLQLLNLQKITTDTLKRQSTENVSIDIYALKFFHEVPDLYPAVNYVDILDSKVVFDERYEYVKNLKGERIVSTSTRNFNYLETCTPPIAIDRNTTYSFDIIIDCLAMYNKMMEYNDDMFTIGQGLTYGTESDFYNKYLPMLENIYYNLLHLLGSYQQGAILTSLVESERIDKFTELVNNLKKLVDLRDFSKVQSLVFDELYGSNYKSTVLYITEPFRSEKLEVFSNMANMANNYFVEEDNSTRFNRPISSECFIALRYHRDDECWLFDYPEIKHFHGIGNTFYINTKLTGTEIFKFFVLYSDTEAPSEQNIEHFDLETVLDFDLFSNEVDKHLGCIRYWDAENRLMKMAKMLYDKYDDETVVQVLSKMLKRKVNGEDIINVYPSEINYEDSNKTTDNLVDYTEASERAPFAINFLFYTLSMLNNNVDKLQAYFYQKLVNKKYEIRYADIDISSIMSDDRYPINYSEFCISPSIPGETTVRPSGQAYAFYGLPLILNSNGNNLYEPYRYVLNVYKSDIQYPIISENGLNHKYYTMYDDITRPIYGGQIISYHDNIYLAKMLTKYLTSAYDYISELQTNYKTTFNQTSITIEALKTLTRHRLDIEEFVRNANLVSILGISDPNDILELVLDDNALFNQFVHLDTLMNEITDVIEYPKTNIVAYINSTVLSTLKFVYVTTGFDNNAMKRARMLYIHLKKINTPMNAYQYQKWIDGIDLHILKNLDDMLAENENYNLGTGVFTRMYEILRDYKERLQARNSLTQLSEMIDALTGTVKTSHTDPIVTYCDDMINKVIFDIYAINEVNFNNSTTYNDKPVFVVVTVDDNSHTYPPIGTQIHSTHRLVFQPIIDKDNNGKYIIKSLSNICEYAFFDGSTLTGLTMNVLDINGSIIGTQTVSIDFIRVSSTADKVNTFDQVSNVNTESIEFQNNHESFEVVNDLVVNEKHAKMNYELLVGNHFTPLDHVEEMILEPETWLPGSVDKLIIDNQLINRMSMAEFGHRKCSDVYFKPAQVIHITPNQDGSIDSVYGKYFEGHSIYLKTTDGLVAFPIKITAVDHSINKGFIEAKVDGWNSKWFKIEDPAKITEYLTSEIECEVVDDNMRNFLDEFSNELYPVYSNPGYSPASVVYDENIDNAYKLPGDPIFVSSNADFVYNRLNWFFNEIVPNRFIDDEHKTHRFIYVTHGFINDEHDELKINMINHDFNQTTLPERYPVLRDEPNDHSIWDAEVERFQNEIIADQSMIKSLEIQRARAEAAVHQAKTIHEREVALIRLDSYDRRIAKLEDEIDRFDKLKRQLEKPTTWFNVRSYNAALVYIANGRADKFSPTFISNIRDLLYTDKVDVFLYDWEHKEWLDPSTYDMSIQMVDNVKIDECDDYTTNRVLYTFTITPKPGFQYSKKILVYFSYDSSDVFEDITMNQPTCSVRFKPILSLDGEITDYDPYNGINIRKHFDGYEKYKVSGEDIHVKRINRTGKYTFSPAFRFIDIMVSDDNGDHTYEDIAEFYVPNKFKNDESPVKLYKPSYRTQIHAEVDSFEPDKEIRLISINNGSYDGNISEVMFNGITSLDNGDQKITITGSTLPNYATGSFVCTVFQSDEYDPTGGVITVTVTHEEDDIYGEWVRVPIDQMLYREIPEEFKLVMNQPTTNDVIVTLSNNYINNADIAVQLHNEGVYDPYTYYWDTKHLVRMPISNVRINEPRERLVIDTSVNDNVQSIKAPYIGICRYSLAKIPQDGFIDLTGYLPTPLSRNRYEFWVNGRCVKDPKDIIILSPTSIQLCNMKSLKNFEVIELVDDVNTDNDLFRQGNLYMDINGNTYGTYKLALLSNSRIRYQDVKFTFNANVHTNINDHTTDIIPNPNNKDLEEDILSYVTFDDSSTDYNKLYNIPTINGVSLFHPKLQGLGIGETPNEDIIKKFDMIWKLEEITNPLFPMTHREGRHIEDEDILKLHIKLITEPHWNGLDIDTSGMYLIYATGPVERYFSLYISKLSDGVIDDVNNTVKIIPFIMPGVYVLIDPKYTGMWLHSTHGKTKPIHIVNTTPD